MLPLVLFWVVLFVTIDTRAQTTTRCEVKALGGGQDDGPNINVAFRTCSNNSIIVLNGYYVVDTLLFTTNLSNVDIVLSGTGEHFLSWEYSY